MSSSYANFETEVRCLTEPENCEIGLRHLNINQRECSRKMKGGIGLPRIEFDGDRY